MKKNPYIDDRLADIEGVHNLDHVGADGRDCKYLLYLTELPLEFYGTNEITKNTNDIIHQMLMRTHNISMYEAIGMALKNQPSLLIEDIDYMLTWEYEYQVIH